MAPQGKVRLESDLESWNIRAFLKYQYHSSEVAGQWNLHTHEKKKNWGPYFNINLKVFFSIKSYKVMKNLMHLLLLQINRHSWGTKINSVNC